MLLDDLPQTIGNEPEASFILRQTPLPKGPIQLLGKFVNINLMPDCLLLGEAPVEFFFDHEQSILFEIYRVGDNWPIGMVCVNGVDFEENHEMRFCLYLPLFSQTTEPGLGRVLTTIMNEVRNAYPDVIPAIWIKKKNGWGHEICTSLGFNPREQKTRDENTYIIYK